MLSINTEDIGTSLRELSGLFKFVPLVFLIPLPFSVYYVLVNDLMGGTPRFNEFFQILGSTSVQDLTAVIVSLITRFFIFLFPAFIAYLLYSVLREMPPKTAAKTKHVMIAVAIGWLMITFISALPYILAGTLDPVDSWFESVSGWSTTGMSLITNLDGTPMDILFYRSLTQWLGGLGIIFMALSVLMRKGTVAMDYYSSDKGERRIKPSIKGTVIEIWKIYGVYTILCCILLYLAGMSLFDALNHSMTVLATGGLSTHNNNIGFFQDKPFVAPVMMIFMVIGSISFFVHFRLFEGNIRSLTENIEFRYMISLFIIVTILLLAAMFLQNYSIGDKTALDCAFQTFSSLTTSGFSTADLSKWPEISQMLLIILIYIGGFYGSTAGGIKLLRFAVILQVVAHSIKKLTVPKTAILRIKMGDRPVGEEEILSVFGFTAAYLMILVVGAVLLMSEFSTLQSFFLSASAIGNGGLINVAKDRWFLMSDFSKVVLASLMWIGRLEVLPVLVFLNSLYVNRRVAL